VAIMMMAILCFFWFFTFKRRIYFYVSTCLFLLSSVLIVNRFIQHKDQNYIAFHRVKNQLIVEEVKGRTSSLYFDSTQLKEVDLEVAMGNYWAKYNVSIVESKHSDKAFVCADYLFVQNVKPDSLIDFCVSKKRKSFEITKGSEVVFTSKDTKSLFLEVGIGSSISD
jgi:hypothetical protein